MTDPHLLFVSPEATARAVIECIEKQAAQVALVVDESGRLLGLVTDGDVRRGLLKGATLDSQASLLMNRSYTSLPEGATETDAVALMRAQSIRHVPVLSTEGKVLAIHILDHLSRRDQLPNRVVVMAGGVGSRLHPLTLTTPKPMLTVAGRPMLELVLERCRDAGFQRFSLAVNYLKEHIIDHFGDGKRLGIEIDYLEEPSPLGTAGALGLIGESLSEPLLVMNGDVLTRVDWRGLLQFHAEHSTTATMAVREYGAQIPFGVVRANGFYLESIEEKPVVTNYVNAGIYVLSPRTLTLIRPGERLDMPDLLLRVKQTGNVAVFPIHEYWLDAGREEDLRRAHEDWH